MHMTCPHYQGQNQSLLVRPFDQYRHITMGSVEGYLVLAGPACGFGPRLCGKRQQRTLHRVARNLPGFILLRQIRLIAQKRNQARVT